MRTNTVGPNHCLGEQAEAMLFPHQVTKARVSTPKGRPDLLSGLPLHLYHLELCKPAFMLSSQTLRRASEDRHPVSAGVCVCLEHDTPLRPTLKGSRLVCGPTSRQRREFGLETHLFWVGIRQLPLH